ncbi:MAG: hypothetical protein MK135_13980 [Polyangiaceae bacterium]|nr:hypothetical protein [Polyangiaceae bacterium]
MTHHSSPSPRPLRGYLVLLSTILLASSCASEKPKVQSVDDHSYPELSSAGLEEKERANEKSPATASSKQSQPNSTTTPASTELSSRPASEIDSEGAASDELSPEEQAALATIAEAEAELSLNSPREIIYHVSPDGLRVEIGEAEFIPRAQVKRVGPGWGLELQVESVAYEDVYLYSASAGPLAFAARVDGEIAVDKKGTGSEILVTPEASQTFSRTWPASGNSPLMPGESLELRVGLWGFGFSSESRRPVRKFCVIKMTATESGAELKLSAPQ